MTDREALLVAYGALKALDGPTRELYDHLFGDKPSESEITHSTYSLPDEGTYKTSTGCISTLSGCTTPGEYRLRRSWCGKIGARLDECKSLSLEKRINEFRGLKDEPVHPDVALDVAAAEKYLETLK